MMTNRYMLACGIAAASALGLSAGSDRLDLIGKDGSLKSYMTDHIRSITYSRAETAPDSDGYTHIVVTTDRETGTHAIGGLASFLYRQLDHTVPFAITVTAEDEHAAFRMLYNFNDPDRPNCIDPDKPYGWRGSTADGPVFYLLAVDKGYSAEYTVTGDYTGRVYSDTGGFITISEADDNRKYGINLDCFRYTMPFEPVSMHIRSTELDTYAGKEFVGTYSGHRINPAAGALQENPAQDFTIELKANGTLVISETGESAISELDMFTFNEENGTFNYVPRDTSEGLKGEYDIEVKYGVSGVIDGDLVFVKVIDILNNKTETNRYYVASAAGNDLDFASGAAEGGYRMLLKAADRYFLIEQYGSRRHAATVEFLSGTSIAGPCEALVSYDGEIQYKYTVAAGAKEPVFAAKGAEAGLFIDSADSGNAIELDGFGRMSSGGKSYRYTAEGSVVTAEIDGIPHIYLLDTAAGTYTEQIDTQEWDGAEYYYSDSVTFFDSDTSSLKQGARVKVWFNHTPNGGENPGGASVEILSPRRTLVASSGKYLYNAESGTVVISNVYMGFSESEAGRRNLVIKVSEDMQSVWFDNSEMKRIYSTARDGEYIPTGRATLLHAMGQEPAE